MEAESDSIVPVKKTFRILEDQIWKDTVLVRAMVGIVESRRTDTWSLYALIVEFYHEEMRDVKRNPRPASWAKLHANHYLTHSFFDSEQEWVAYFEGVKLRGKPSPANPELALPARLFREAHLKHEKWKLLKSEILNYTHVEWVKMFPSGRMESGETDIMVYVERLRKTLFKKWCFEPTSKTSKMVYKVWGLKMLGIMHHALWFAFEVWV